MAAKRQSGKGQGGGRKPPLTEAEREDDLLDLAEEILRVSREEEAGMLAGWDKFLKQLGIRGKPIGAKKLREMLLQRGFDPQSNEFSQGIIAMREE
jgi:hypothetical protein